MKNNEFKKGQICVVATELCDICGEETTTRMKKRQPLRCHHCGCWLMPCNLCSNYTAEKCDKCDKSPDVVGLHLTED